MGETRQRGAAGGAVTNGHSHSPTNGHTSNGHSNEKEKEKEKSSSKLSTYDRCCNYLEAFAWMISVLFVFYYYNFIGELARLRGVNYNHLMLTPWDLKIPVISEFILPYLAVYALVWVYWIMVCYRNSSNTGTVAWDLSKLRRGWGVHISLILVGYLLFYLVPVHIEPLGGYEPGDRWIDILAFQVVHRGMTRYAAWPSMHVANAWFCVWLHKTQNLPGIWVARILSYLQFVDTLFVRAHYIADLPAGLLLAEFFGRFVLTPIENGKWFQRERALPLIVILLIPVVFYAPIIYLSTLTDWGGLANLLK